ncbi:Chaperone protein ClpB [Zhongshania aliphaticivorans]|uniref:Chaperone protein ClpB n=1 Tax=Zhongshania aliphaticivorans TaxID=1470434 RepID=A0A5S9MTC5_9GAMM|nr:AAA family ATPase [Zhongshania aliphaticivorans]CAA0080306.1 Chaperone protein ClpB [Zhongshania aliphaticivorans]CAA0085783.1 Chaperone protein ClpB [Zhongshania aliphaticivorans]
MPFINDQLAASQGGVTPPPETPPHISSELFAEACVARSQREFKRHSRFRFDVDTVMSLLRERIIAQNESLTAIEDMLHVVKADIGRERGPLSVMLLMGPTGVGKTETARLIAQGICGNADALCRIDMNTLAQDHYAAALTGAPPGYVGSKEGHTLFPADAIAGSYSVPSVVLFDEVEKASTEVLRSLLNVLDSGRLTLSSGVKELDFRNSIIFLSSNIAAPQLERHRNKRYMFGARKAIERKIIDRALRQAFDPEFINRIDSVLVYQHLQRSDLNALLDIELQHLQVRLQKQGLSLELDSSCYHYLLRHYDTRYGARDLARQLRMKLEPVIARAMLAAPESNRFIGLIQNKTLFVEAVHEP